MKYFESEIFFDPKIYRKHSDTHPDVDVSEWEMGCFGLRTFVLVLFCIREKIILLGFPTVHLNSTASFLCAWTIFPWVKRPLNIFSMTIIILILCTLWKWFKRSALDLWYVFWLFVNLVWFFFQDSIWSSFNECSQNTGFHFCL